MPDEVNVGTVREPPDWIPAPRFREERLRVNDGVCCDERGVVYFPVGARILTAGGR
jgi:hypothetical protein